MIIATSSVDVGLRVLGVREVMRGLNGGDGVESVVSEDVCLFFLLSFFHLTSPFFGSIRVER